MLNQYGSAPPVIPVCNKITSKLSLEGNQLWVLSSMLKIPDILFGSKMETDLTGLFGTISVEAVHIDQYDLPKFPVPF